MKVKGSEGPIDATVRHTAPEVDGAIYRTAFPGYQNTQVTWQHPLHPPSQEQPSLGGLNVTQHGSVIAKTTGFTETQTQTPSIQTLSPPHVTATRPGEDTRQGAD